MFWISSSYFQVTNAEQLLTASTQSFLLGILLDYNYRPAFNINYCNSPCSGALCSVIMASLAVHSTFLILQPGEVPSWQDVVNKTAMFWGFSVGFLIWPLKTDASYSIQNKQGQPAQLEHGGSWFLLHLQPQNQPMDGVNGINKGDNVAPLLQTPSLSVQHHLSQKSSLRCHFCWSI